MRDRASLPHLAELETLAASAPGLRLLVLHGSRARDRAHEFSDWDFGYLADAAFDPDALLARLVEQLGADRIDLVGLASAGALLRFRVAEFGVMIFEAEPGLFQSYRLDAIDAWCDLAPILGPAYERQLATLAR